MRLALGCLLILKLLVVLPAAQAVEHCKVKRLRSDGTLLVQGRNVTGTLRWGPRLGEETNVIFNASDCIRASGKAKRCVLGPQGSPERTTSPAGCVIYLADGGPGRCSTAVKGCLPAPPPLPCPLFPPDNVWNTEITALPIHTLSDAYVDSIGRSSPLHPDFGAGLLAHAPIGIPYTVVPIIQPLVPITFLYADESDPGPYPIPPLVPVEGGARLGKGRGDRHVIVVEENTCTLYEMFYAKGHKRGQFWTAYSGAIWDLNSNALRPETWTSADAAGLPILAGLIRYEEIEAGEIIHAVRFTAPRTQRAYVWPARHFASSSTDPTLPPMGIRARLKADFDISGFSVTNQIILTALKRYGMILADNGSPWFISGLPDPRWDNNDLANLKALAGRDFEFVDTSSMMVDPDSGLAQ